MSWVVLLPRRGWFRRLKHRPWAHVAGVTGLAALAYHYGLLDGLNPGCNIKGNINASGERIYHVPGQRYYDATRIILRSGERWFCSEAEARAAGWRRSRL